MEDKKIVCQVVNLSKKYKDKVLFNDANLTIYHGDRIGIIGKNGIGKTTLLNMIIGKTNLDSGKIIFNDDFIKNKIIDIGYIQQEFKFPTFFKVKDIYNLVLSDLKFNNIYDKDYFENIVNLLDIKDLLNKKYFKLSAGEKQKVNIFSILVYKHKLLLLDEFISNIDIETSQKIRTLLNKYSQTLLLVSHNIKDVIDTCNKLVFINSFKINESKDVKEINEEVIKKLLLNNS